MPPTRKAEKSAPLQRGLACLSCRKRKLKCDGKRPVCTSCIKMKREGECEYEDKKQKSRTQKLKEKLAMLEERIRELEGPEESGSGTPAALSGSPGAYDPPVQLHDTAQLLALPDLDNIDLSTLADVGGSRPVSVAGWPSFSASSSASSSSGSLGPVSRSVTGSPFGTGDDNEVDLDQLLGISISGSNMEFANPFNNGLMNTSFSNLLHWDPKSPLPEENKQILLDLFYAHRHQCWFDGDFSRFDPTKSPHHHIRQVHQQATEPHPALWNSIYLLACHFAHSPFLVKLENNFLTRTLHEITVALDNSDRLSDVVQASCLLAVYLFSNGRILEGYCHSFSAARLAVGLGLHQLQHPKSFSQGASHRSDSSSPSSSNQLPGLITGLGPSGASPIPIPPPRNSFELRNRISAFWQVFMVDRCWSVANGLPVALPDGEHHRGRIKTPWPEPPDEEMMNNDSSFPGVYMPMLKAKAAALYERTFRLASASNKTDGYWVEHNTTLHALQRFSTSIPFFVGYEAWRTRAPFLDVELFSVHTLVNVCNIHLHGGVVQSSEIDLSNGSIPLQAANFIMSLIRQLSQGDYEYLDPLVSACWLSVAKLYIRLLNAMALGTMTSLPAYAIEGELDVIVNAMRTLSVFVPLAGEHAKKVEEERGFSGSMI